MKDKILQSVKKLYIEGLNPAKIYTKITTELHPDVKIARKTVYNWIRKYQSEWDILRKQRELEEIEKGNQLAKEVENSFLVELSKADALDYQDLCELQQRYKEIALATYKPKAAEIVIACVKVKREIRERIQNNYQTQQQAVIIINEINTSGDKND